MKTSGQYFIDDGTDIRIGCSEDIESRLKKHQSSNRKAKLVAIIPTDPKEIFDEEQKAFNYFKEYKLRDLKILQPFMKDIVNIYDQVWDKWRNSDKPSNNKYLVKALWVNFQRQHEFNPPHDHSDELSFVAYLKIPKEIKEE